MKQEGLLLDLEAALKIAHFMQDEMMLDFFDKYEPAKEKEDMLLVAYDFERYRYFAEVVNEKINTALKCIAEITSNQKQEEQVNERD
ncbi:hypothetical protein [Metasolibacillus meyeri]|uniref:hypothetical protein n=1 Tax=Metasolibacillus meyeri TaxID=1071052 RepID=UPI000D304FC5|nr:hypothetical protein [Metasolibacillus meyeri]